MFKFADEDKKKYTKIAEGKVDTTKPSRKERMEKLKEKNGNKEEQYQYTLPPTTHSREFNKLHSMINSIKNQSDYVIKQSIVYCFLKSYLSKDYKKEINMMRVDEVEILYDEILETFDSKEDMIDWIMYQQYSKS